MVKLPPDFDDSRLPVALGNPLRVPFYAWSNWGISYSNEREKEELIRMSEQAYRDEWDTATEPQYKDIAVAAERAGLSDANAKLNEKNAEIIAKVIHKKEGKISIMDLGAGSGDTTITILKHLDERDRKRLSFTLLDPAGDALSEAKERIAKLGLIDEENYRVVTCPDLDIPLHVREESQDIITTVAAIHHHADLGTVLSIVYSVTKKGGFFVTADWHNSMWEHPNRVYKMLEQMDWQTKKEDLNRFVKIYPLAREDVGNCKDLAEERANEQIIDFWRNYAAIRIGDGAHIILEGHRPVKKYVKEVEASGFRTDTKDIREITNENPLRIMTESSLLCVTIGQKIEH